MTVVANRLQVRFRMRLNSNSCRVAAAPEGSTYCMGKLSEMVDTSTKNRPFESEFVNTHPSLNS
jgi:hypothetical protein